MTIFDLDSWQEILGALIGNPLRTFLTAFGVFWGIFMLMVMLGSGAGLENGVTQGFQGQATNSFYVWTRQTTVPFRGLPAGRGLTLTNEDTRAIRRLVPEVLVVAPRNQLGGYDGGNNVTRGTHSGAFEVMGDVPQYREIERAPIERGRFLNALDMRDRRKVAVIGTRVQELLFEDGENPIGESIRIQGVSFKVIGVFRTRQTGEQAGRDTETIFVPFSTFQHAFNQGNRVGWFAITSRDDVPASVAQERVLSMLRKRHRVSPDDERAFGSYNTEEEFNEINGLFLGISVLVWIVGIGTLTAGAIGVSNIMLVIVKERTNEIGIRRAIGAGPLSIMGQIVMESVLLTCAAGYLGLLCGMGIIEVVGRLLEANGGGSEMFANPNVSVAAALQALGILVLAGVLAGVIPARRAVRINTVEALRSS